MLELSDRFAKELFERYAESFAAASPWVVLTTLTVALTGPLLLRPSPTTTPRLRLLLALPIAVAAMAWSYHWLWYGDDAFISFRYARNLAEGHGLVFNPGERVEGYTNFLWTVILAAGLKVGVSPLLLSILLSLTSLGAIIVGVTWLTARLAPAESPVLVSIAAVAVAHSYVMASYGTSGLETMFAAAMALGMLVAATLRRYALAGVLGIAAALSHPDHILYYGAMGLALLTDPEALKRPLFWVKDKERRLLLLKFCAPLVLIFIPYYLTRWAYYGDFYPNTYYAKSGGVPYFSQGVRYLAISLVETGAFIAVPLAVYAASARLRRLEARYFIIAAPLFCFYTAKIGGDFMLGRLFVALVPLVLCFAECGVRDLATNKRVAVRVLSVALAAGILLSTVQARVVRPGEKFWHISDEGSFFRASKPSLEGVQGNYLAGRADDLNELLKRGIDPLMGIGNVGIVGYLAPARIRDILALTDREVAHMPITVRARPGHEKIARGPWLLKHQVDLSDDPIYPEPYTKVGIVRIGRTDYFMSGFDPKFVKQLRTVPKVRLPSIERYIDRYEAAATRGDHDRLACDLWFLNEFYFRHNADEARRKRVLEKVIAAYPDLQGGAELFLRGATGLVERPVFALSDSEGWKATGAAFSGFPTTGLVADQGFVYGQSGPFANTWSATEADKAQGKLLSKPFRIEGDVITLDVGGGMNNQKLSAALLVDGKPVRRATGCNADTLSRRVWDVAEFRGKEARIELADRESGGWGHLLVDSVSQWSRP